MTRDDLETKLRELAARRPAGPGEPALHAMADRIWHELRASRPSGRRRLVWLVPLAMAAGAALLLLPGRPPAPLPERPIDEDLREFEQTLSEPASAGEMLLEMDENELRDLLAALQSEVGARQ